MRKINFKLSISFVLILSGLFFFTSCNKSLEQLAPIAKPVYPGGPGIAATLAANPSYSNYAALIARAGMTNLLNDSTKTFTVFATNNNGMNLFATAASGGAIPYPAPDAVVLAFINGSLPVASAAGIVQYNTIGQKFTFSSFGTAFPNYPITSQIILDPNQPFVRMPIFPDGGTPYSYVNNLPLIASDMVAANGLIHTTYSIVAPPTAVLKTLIDNDVNLTYFKVAIARADSGIAAGTSQFGFLLNYGVTNMTVLAPNDAAFQTLVFGLVYSQVFAATGNAALATATANGAVAAGPNFLLTNNVSTALVRGIVAYHLLASLTASTTTPYQPNIRVFSNNISTTPIFIKTLVNGSLAVHPGVKAEATYTGPAVTSLKFTGYGTFPPGGAPFSGPAANAVSWDKHAVNGVYHIIDKVLLPQ